MHRKTPLAEFVFFFNKVAAPRLATSFKERLWYGCFPVNFPRMTAFGTIQYIRCCKNKILAASDYCLQNINIVAFIIPLR